VASPSAPKVDGLEPLEAGSAISYLVADGVGFLYWADEELAVSFCPSRASTHLLDEVARVVLSSFHAGIALSSSDVALTLSNGNVEEDLAVRRSLTQTMLALANAGLLRPAP
jgi:hypothetical protein